MIGKVFKYGVVYPTFLLGSLASMLLLSLNKRRVKKATNLPPEISLLGLHTAIFLCFKYGLRSNWLTVLSVKALMVAVNYFTWNFRILGLTGGIACGKTTASNVLRDEAQLKIIDCDTISHQLVEPGRPAYNRIVQAFGDAVIDHQTGQINRQALGQIVFGDRNQRIKLNKIVHKYLAFALMKEVFRHIKNRERVVVLDAPLLFESKILPIFCEPIMVIYISDQEEQINRIMHRDHCTRIEALNKINSQMRLIDKVRLADIKIANDGTQDELRANVMTAVVNEGLIEQPGLVAQALAFLQQRLGGGGNRIEISFGPARFVIE